MLSIRTERPDIITTQPRITSFKDIKTFAVDIKSDVVDDIVTLSGYANTKNTPDAYGKPVYNISRYKQNPVLLVDHNSGAYLGWRTILVTGIGITKGDDGAHGDIGRNILGRLTIGAVNDLFHSTEVTL